MKFFGRYKPIYSHLFYIIIMLRSLLKKLLFKSHSIKYTMNKQNQKMLIPTIQGTKKQWQIFGEIYSEMDSCFQTFFYTLSNLLHLQNAEKILEIGCGTGKLLPMILDLKNPNAQYYATDISQKMLEILKIKLNQHFQRYQSKLTLEEWMIKMKIELNLVNGEQNLSKQILSEKEQNLKKFDRIIANQVLMLTPNPQKMLKNLFDHSKSGCLFGVSVWGSKQKNNFHTIFNNLSIQYKFPETPKSRSNFHLYQRLDHMAGQYGWKLLLNWQQNGIFQFFNSKQVRSFAKLSTSRMNHLNSQQQVKLQDGFVEVVNNTLKSKNPLQFPAECYIFMKP